RATQAGGIDGTGLNRPRETMAPARSGPQHLRRSGASAVALVLAVLLAGAPPLAGPVLAAGDLRVAADATYELDPDAGRVHVAVRFRVTNLKPSTATILYFYRDVGFAIQEDARAVRAADG